MRYVRLKKLREVEDAEVPSSNFSTFLLGEQNLASTPPGYEVEGWLLDAPLLGGRVRIKRVKRNGVDSSGDFFTSEVTVLGKRGFCTANSVYVMDEVDPPSGLPMATYEAG